MNYLLIGPPGWGKTTAACTSAKLPIFLIDVDGKARQMENLKSRIESGDIVIYDMKNPLIEGRLSARALNPDQPIKNQPKGYVEVIDLLNDIIDGVEEYQKYGTIIVDSLTRLCEHMTRLLIYHRGRGKFGKVDVGTTAKEVDLNWPSWGSYKSNLEELFDAVTKFMPEDVNFICTVHQKEMTETQYRGTAAEVTVVTGYRPMIDGQMREKLTGYFNEAYYLERKDSKMTGRTYSFRTAGAKYDARTSLQGLPELVEADISTVGKERKKK
jgi:hypothetical protein